MFDDKQRPKVRSMSHVDLAKFKTRGGEPKEKDRDEEVVDKKPPPPPGKPLEPSALDELPLLVTLMTGERLRVLCNSNDKFEDIQKTVWKKAALTEDSDSHALRLRNAEVVFSNQSTARDLWQNWLLYREPGFTDTFELTLLDKRDIGDAMKKHSKLPSTNGLIRASGYLKKRSSSGVQKWHSRFFVLQDYSLFYFSSQEDYEKKLPASDIIPMGSCKVEIVSEENNVVIPRHPAGRKSIGAPLTGPEEFTFRLGAEVVGKREFLLRTKQPEELHQWVSAINAINLARVKRIVFDSTRELMERIDEEDLLHGVKVQATESPEAEKLLRVYAYGMFPKLEYAADGVLFELIVSSLRTLGPPLLPESFLEVAKKGSETNEIKSLMGQIPLALRPLIEHLIIFGHFISSYSEINGLTRHAIASLLAAALLPGEVEGPKVLLFIIDRRPKLWPETVEGQLSELRHLFFVEAPVQPRSRRQSKDSVASAKQVDPHAFVTGKLNRLTTTDAPSSPGPGISASQAALLSGLVVSPRTKPVLPSQVRFPLTFTLPSAVVGDIPPAKAQEEVRVRVVEELKLIEGRQWTPGRFYSFEDLKKMNNQESEILETLIPDHVGSVFEYTEECVCPQKRLPDKCMCPQDKTPSPYVPEVVCMAYLISRGNLTALSQLANYLRNCPAPPKREQQSLYRSAGASEPSFVEKSRRSILRNLEGGDLQATHNSRRIRRAPKRAMFDSDDDDEFVDIDTAAPPVDGAKGLGSSGSGGSKKQRAGRRVGRQRRSSRSASMSRRKQSMTMEEKSVSKMMSVGAPPLPPPPPLPLTPGSTTAASVMSPISTANGSTPASSPGLASPKQLDTFCSVHDTETIVFCRECKENFCHECDEYVHQIGNKRAHVRTKLVPGPPRDFTFSPSPRISVTERPPERSSGERLDRANTLDEPEVSPQKEQTPSTPAGHSRSMTMTTRGRTHSEDMQHEKVMKPISFEANSSFEHVMRYAESRACFRKFLASEYSEENIVFWDEVNKFLNEEAESQFKLAKYIYETFFGPKSTKQINVRGMNSQVKEALTAADPADAVQQCTFLFLEAQATVVALLKWDSFPRFRQSPIYEQFRDQFQKRELVRMKVVKEKKLHKNAMRVLQFDSHLMTLTFFKQDADGEFGQVECTIPAGNLVNVQLSVKRPKKLKLTFFKDNQRLLRNQKEWRLVFRTISERERLARLITTNLLLCRNAAPSRYEPQPLVLDRKTQERVREFPVVELAHELHEAFVVDQHRDGWVAGKVFSEDAKSDPTLIPFQELNEGEQDYLVGVASLIVGSILELGYTVALSYDDQVLDLDEDSQLLLLVEFLAENVHDCWAFNQMKAGWVYGETRSVDNKTHPNLIPYIDLYEADMDRNRQTAITVLRSLIDRGYKIQPDT